MPPRDPSPLGDEMANTMPEPKFPEPKPGKESDEPVRGEPAAHELESDLDISHRPALPEHPEAMAADIEDEEADPVVDTGRGIADGPTGHKAPKG
jgi:hypothetical protein